MPRLNKYIDGVNEAGLSAVSLWFDGEFQNISDKDYPKASTT